MAGRHGTDGWTSKSDVREHGRRCALAGKPIWVNPYLGEDAQGWFAAYRDVPEAERGSQPHLQRPTRGTLTTKQIATRIAYHERILSESICATQRARAERALRGLRAAVPCDQHAPMPRPWTEGASL